MRLIGALLSTLVDLSRRHGRLRTLLDSYHGAGMEECGVGLQVNGSLPDSETLASLSSDALDVLLGCLQAVHANGSSTTSAPRPRLRSSSPAALLKWWIYVVGMPAIGLPGLLANVASVVVFSRRSMRTSQNAYLAGLALFDCGVLFLAVGLFTPLSLGCGRAAPGSVCMAYLRIIRPAFYLGLVAQFGSVWTCVAIAADRVLAVRFPLRSRRWCGPRKAVRVLCGILIAGCLYRLPCFWELEVRCGFSRRSNATLCRLAQSPLRRLRAYQTYYKTWLYAGVVFVAPFGLMVGLNGVLVQSLRRALWEREALQRRASTASAARLNWDSERRCTLTALLVIGSFVLSNLLAILNNVLESRREGRAAPRDDSLLLKAAIYLGNLLICLNSATNFLIYCAMGKRFRRVFLDLFCPCLGGGELSRQRSFGSSKKGGGTPKGETAASSRRSSLRNGHKTSVRRLASVEEQRELLEEDKRQRFTRAASVGLMKQSDHCVNVKELQELPNLRVSFQIPSDRVSAPESPDSS